MGAGARLQFTGGWHWGWGSTVVGGWAWREEAEHCQMGVNPEASLPTSKKDSFGPHGLGTRLWDWFY